MSTYSIYFIPEKYSFLPSEEQQTRLSALAAQFGARIDVNDDVRFADAGSNFTEVLCPYCGSDCLPWWGERMDAASDGKGSFQSLDIIAPCCGQKTNLHKLHYKMQQGFYRYVWEIIPPDEKIDTGAVARALQDATNMPWRIIHSHY